MDLPLGLATALESGKGVLFIGAGAGHEMRTPSGAHAPTGEGLAASLASHFKVDAGDSLDLAMIAQVVENRHGRAKLIAHVERELASLEPSQDLQWLTSLTWKAIFTTNYDNAIERAYQRSANPTQTPVTVATNSEVTSWDPRFEVPIFHLHGSLASSTARDAILITQSDYARFRVRRQMLFDHFRLSFAESPILYFGYSHRDPNWQMITQEVRAEFSPKDPPPSYRIAPETPVLERELLASQGVTTLDGDLGQFRSTVELVLGSIRVEPYRLDELRSHIPTDLHEAFATSPAAVSRLLNSWDYVNQADFASAPNTRAFLRGDRPTWSLLGQGIGFERDLEQRLVDRLLDFATDPKPRVTCEVVLGPAGYGTTTLLMAVGAWFARNRIGRTFYLKPGMAPTSGDVEFAARSYDGPVVFVVDNASDHIDALDEITELLRNIRVPAFLLLGDRLNEWRERRPSIKPFEYLLEPLSDDEITRLLERLETLGELGSLSALSIELRIAAIKQRNQQELLVTMREVTEGKAFDAIIEDEFRNIADPAAQELYALVCAFSRSRALVRDMLCAEALGHSTSRLYEILGHSLDGILAWETVDAARGIEALRARHQVIADIVWDRCIDRLERERLLLAAISGINLTYGLDAKAFEAFTRDDDAVDSLQTLEAKTRFFEDACRKDPGNAYVLQHYARMLRREGRIELALGQIDSAIRLAPNARILQHTRGVILHDAAMEATSREMGRRRLAQSEDAFRGAIRRSPRDEYSFQSLAELYLDWAKQASTDAEAIDYVAKAQNVVSDALAVVRNREGIYLVSSKIEKFLGDESRRLDALRSALASAPTSAVVRYLLGNALRLTGAFGEAESVLRLGLQDHPDDPNLAWAFAVTRFQSTGSYDESLAVLHLARLRGEHDPRFIATLGGMLVMSGQLDEAQEVWRRAASRNFAFEDRARVGFRPEPTNGPVELLGRVLRVASGFAFVGSVGMPDFFCHSSRYSGLVLRPDLPVYFTVGFSARGPVATAIRAVGQ
ncbi:SIR2 family protein (plasmid) [Cellulomonas sp. WB94]|uniref:P-loop NTPase n=1 Tax=Cellulomonas sp. WB94 TaxID=2173174 RepID=UPI000D564648|nr:SIR2 family protein [Cellulomonas sp. WB94]PVU81370.1 SIR2 family protein [Cellulomonas sp. WB94]